MVTENFEKFTDEVKNLGIRFYREHVEEADVPWEPLEAYLLERYGEVFLEVEVCRKLTAFALFHVRATDPEWYRVLMLDEAFCPLTTADIRPLPVASPEEILPFLRGAGLAPEQIRRMALHGVAFAIWLAADQVRQAVAMCASEADAEALRGVLEAEMESDPESARWE